MHRLKKLVNQERILGGAIALAITQLGASIVGLVRDRALTTTFPGLRTVDVYIASFRVSDLLFQMFIMAGFSVALVPLLSKYKASKDLAKMSTLLSGIMNTAAIFFACISGILAVAFPYIAPWLTNFTGADLELYITYGRLALLSNFLFVFGNAFGQYLITIQRYWIYGITPIIYTLGTISGTLWLSSPDTFGQLGPMVGTLIGGILYVLIRLLGVLHSGLRLHTHIWHEDTVDIIWLMLPRTFALGTLQLQLLLFDKVASGIGAGAVTINAYARNFQSVAVGIAGIALAQSAFSLLSQAYAQKEFARFWIYIRKSSNLIAIITIPGAIALVLLAPVAASIVGVSSKLELFSMCILIYAVSIPFESLNHLLLRGYYSAKVSVIPAIISVINGGIAIASAWVFTKYIGIYALPLGFTIGQILQSIGLYVLLPKYVPFTTKKIS